MEELVVRRMFVEIVNQQQLICEILFIRWRAERVLVRYDFDQVFVCGGLRGTHLVIDHT